MTKAELGSGILKTDKRGRVHVSAQRSEELLREFDKSGLSAPKFAAVTGLKCQTLAGWLFKRRRQGAGTPAAVCSSDNPSVLEWWGGGRRECAVYFVTQAKGGMAYDLLELRPWDEIRASGG